MPEEEEDLPESVRLMEEQHQEEAYEEYDEVEEEQEQVQEEELPIGDGAQAGLDDLEADMAALDAISGE